MRTGGCERRGGGISKDDGFEDEPETLGLPDGKALGDRPETEPEELSDSILIVAMRVGGEVDRKKTDSWKKTENEEQTIARKKVLARKEIIPARKKKILARKEIVSVRKKGNLARKSTEPGRKKIRSSSDSKK